MHQPLADFGTDEDLTFEQSLRSLGGGDVESLYLPANGTAGSPTDKLHKLEVIPIQAGSKRITTGLLIGQYPHPVPHNMKYLPDRTDLTSLIGAMVDTLKPEGMAILDMKTFQWNNLSIPDFNSAIIQAIIDQGLSHTIIPVTHQDATEDELIVIFKEHSPRRVLLAVRDEIANRRGT